MEILKGIDLQFLSARIRTSYKRRVNNNNAGVRKSGFNNFFYLQRFGPPRLTSHCYGYYVLSGNYQNAVNSFLTDQSIREPIKFQYLRMSIRNALPDWGKVRSLPV